MNQNGTRFGVGLVVSSLVLLLLAVACGSDRKPVNPTSPDAGPAPCGSGMASSADAGTGCRPLVTCSQLNCGDSGRACIEATAAKDAVCGACSKGESLSGGSCMLPDCTTLNCAASHRTCTSSPKAMCDEACLTGYVWDAALKACRSVKTCADLACPGTQQCQPETDVKDAICKGAQCPSGKGYDPSTDQCRPCSGGFSPNCNADGETGKVIVLESKDGATCACETQPGYYIGAQSGTAVPCDADGDGWVSDSAQPSLEGDNALVRENSRCTVRRVGKVVLQNESMDNFTAEDFAMQFSDPTRAVPPGLPLYESARNDGAVSGVGLPNYGGGSLDPRTANSLTKYCSVDDFNDNGVSDLEEWSNSKVDLGSSRPSKTLAAYYEKYTKLAYFAELNNGWYEPATDQAASGAVYRIAERLRSSAGAQGVPMVYPASAIAGAESDAKLCVRHLDTQFKWTSTFDGAKLQSPNTIGGDYVGFGNIGWKGMTHHSQFKCVKVLGETRYRQDSLDDEVAPQMVFAAASQLRRIDKKGVVHTLPWYPNNCSLKAEVSDSPGASPRGAFADLSCVGPGTPPAEGTVVWVSVGFENAAQTTQYMDYLHAGTYVRGCRNECAELSQFAGLPGCDTCKPGLLGKGQVVHGSSNAGQACGHCGGTLQCDGKCSKPDPSGWGTSCGSCGATIQCDGTCNSLAPAHYGEACGSCGGTVRCDGTCSIPTPSNYGAQCGTCNAGTIQCGGSCSKSQPDWWGQPCGGVHCGGIRNSCDPSACSGKADPPDWGQIKVASEQKFPFSCCSIDNTEVKGNACDTGWVYYDTINNSSGGGICGGGKCELASPGGGSSCFIGIHYYNVCTDGANCDFLIRERRVCD